MKSIVIIAIISLLSLITATQVSLASQHPASSCQIKLMDDDTWGKQNKVYNSRVYVRKLPYDLRQDVAAIWMINNSAHPCKYTIYTCRATSFRSCKRWSGTLSPRQRRKLVSHHYIKKMVSIKGSNLIQVPKPKPIVKISLPKIPKITLPKLPKLPKIPTLPTIPTPAPITPPTTPGKKPISPKPLDPAQAAAAAKGGAFCKANCVIDMAKIQKRCLVGTKLIPCKRCTGKPTNTDVGMKSVCETVCNANLPSSPCDFYGYLNNQKKAANTALLAKYGLSILRKFKKFR